MNRRPIKRPAQRKAVIQPLPDEVVQNLLNLIQVKFYQGFPDNFAKHRRDLMGMVILRFAGWLNARGVPLAGDRYRDILRSVLMDAAANMKAENIKYLPAYLGCVVQRYLAHHGDEIYDEAKSFRNVLQAVLPTPGKQPTHAPDVVKDLMAAKRLIMVATGKKTAQPKRPVKEQLSLL